MDIYREVILDHYKHPRNYGHLTYADKVSEEHNISCGDRLTIEILLSKDKSHIEDVRFNGVGCAISMASASMLTEKIKKMKTEEVRRLSANDILDLLGVALTPSRVKCAVLSLEVVHKALFK